MAELLAANQITIAKVLDGETGADGYSPTVTTGTSSDGSTTVIVTNKDGSTTTTLVDGTARVDIDTLSDKTRSGYIETLSGTGFVQSNKTEDGGTAEVVVYGKSEQLVTEQSANLCPKYDKWTLSGGAYVDGDYIVFPSSGAKAQVSVHWKKAYNYLWFIISGKSDSNEAVDLYIGCSNGNGWARPLMTDETTLNGVFGGDGDDYGNKLLNSDYVTFTMSHYGTGKGSMRIRNFMVSKTYIDTSSAYVPFVPDSPSPEYPSEIQSVENPKVTVCGKNIWDEEWEVGSIGPEGQLVVSANVIRSVNHISVEASTDYYFYIGTSTTYEIHFYDGNKKFISYSTKNVSGAFTTPSNCEFIRFVPYSTYGTTYKNDICISKGSTATDYEPYKGKTATLSDIVLRSAGEAKDRVFKDSDGVWKVERNVSKVDLGTLDWRYNGSYQFFYATIPTMSTHNTKQGLCLKYVSTNLWVTTEQWINSDKIVTFGGNDNLVRIKDTAYTDYASFEAAMPGVMLVYELATPTYEILSDSIQAELNALTTYNPVTNVMVSDGVTPDIDVSFWTRDYRAKIAAENAAKVATNFIGYDSTNGLVLGNKESGSWVGYRTQIDNDSFNVLDENGSIIASYGSNEVELGKGNPNAVIKMCDGKAYVKNYIVGSQNTSVFCGQDVTVVGEWEGASESYALFKQGFINIGQASSHIKFFNENGNMNQVEIQGQNITINGELALGTALSIANGGTGAKTAVAACKNLGAVAAEDTGWVNLATVKGTWDYCQYRYKNGIVYIRGYATAYAWSGSTGDVVVAAETIPSQYRPPDNLDLIVRCGGTRWGQIVVTASGGILVDRILNGTTADKSSSWIRFNGSYPI